jgi:hypothetical protein
MVKLNRVTHPVMGVVKMEYTIEANEGELLWIREGLRLQVNDLVRKMNQCLEWELEGLTYGQVHEKLTGKEKKGTSSEASYTATEDLDIFTCGLHPMLRLLTSIDQELELGL